MNVDLNIESAARIAVLLTCHNRKDHTLACLAALYAQNYDLGQVDVFLVDDGSSDGTAQAVKAAYPRVQVLQGNGSLYWNRGMHLAFQEAHAIGYAYYLWLNDDTYLYPEALNTLFASYSKAGTAQALIVGTARDTQTQTASYGGYRRTSRWHPFRYELVMPNGNTPLPCHTLCGNCVLIPWQVVAQVGLINPAYRHRWGDVDYGLRAARKGCSVFIASDYIGTCSFNTLSNSWENKSMALKARFKAINSIKGLHKEDWKLYNKEFGGPLWVLFWLSPYLKILLTSFFSKPTSH